MRNKACRLGLAIALVAASAAGAQATFEPLPPPPSFDKTPIEGGEAMDAALKAIGPLASLFIDHWAEPPFFVGPQDVWFGKFFTKPRVVKPGLCVERMLVVPLRLSREPTGQSTWQPYGVGWVDQTRVVGRFDASEKAARDPKAEADCQDLTAYKSSFRFGLLQSGSVEQAWQAGLLLEDIVAAAQNRAALPFKVECKRLDDKACDPPRRALARLKLVNLQDAFPCDRKHEATSCLRLRVEIPGNDGANYWLLSVHLGDGKGSKITDVAMELGSSPTI